MEGGRGRGEGTRREGGREGVNEEGKGGGLLITQCIPMPI